MVIYLAIILVFVILVFAAFLVSVGAILWYMRRQAAQSRPAGRTAKKEKIGDELDETQAAKITATWNILNPP